MGAARAAQLFGVPDREDPDHPYTYDEKPVVGAAWVAVQDLCAAVSTAEVLYRLPTEAEWEKAARGGRIGCPYPWGMDPPSADCCDFNRFEQFAIQHARRFPPNGYGLYAMSGGVWEWTADWYDAHYYEESPRRAPTGPAEGVEKVLRGGCWADCAEAVTVSFRMSRKPDTRMSPCIGFRLCRVEGRPRSA
jgi:sulfatase modifying factor 1